MLFIRPATYAKFCRWLTAGIVTHITACRARIDATEAVVVTPTRPPARLLCGACGRDLDAKLQRVPAADLRVSVREIGNEADLAIEVDPARTTTADMRGGRRDDALREWNEGGVPEIAMDDIAWASGRLG